MAGVGAGGALLPGLIGTVGKTFGLEMMAASFILMAVIVFIFHELAIRPQKEKIKRMVVEPTE
jgi:fucose permease